MRAAIFRKRPSHKTDAGPERDHGGEKRENDVRPKEHVLVRLGHEREEKKHGRQQREPRGDAERLAPIADEHRPTFTDQFSYGDKWL